MAEQLQEILTGILQATVPSSLAFNASSTLPSNATQNSSDASPLGSSAPGDLLAMIPLLFSFSASRDWVKIFLLGGFFETCRRIFSSLYQKALESFYMTATFDDEDVSYQWMMVWLSKQPSWASIREVEVSTETYGANSSAVNLDDDDDDIDLDMKSTRKLSYIPSPSKTYTMWYKRRYLTVTRTQEQSRWGKTNVLTISLMTRKHRLLAELLKEARRAYMNAQQHKMCIWTADSNNNWRQVARREKRSLKSIVLDPGVKDLIIADARDFLSSRKWYTERGIPFRRGYLLYGAPGSGKTSLIHSMAGELELDVYIISLSRIGLDDAGLDSLINDLPEKCVALMEDIDAAFTHGLTREPEEDTKDSDGEDKPIGPRAGPSSPGSGARVSLSGLLNALDGIGAQEGRILFATTNKYSSLDPALCRPGRMDLHIEFKNASKYQAQELFKRFYNPNDSLDDVAEVVGLGDGELEDKLEEDDSGYTSSAMETSEDSSKAVVSGSMHHKRARRLTALRMNELAERFSAAIPERQISMASLQGYLMTYKIRAADAAKNVEAWVQKELKDKLEMESKKRDRDRRRAEKKAEREKSKAERASSDRGNESDGDGDFKANSRRRKRKTKKNDSERSGMEEDRKRAKGSKTPRDAAAEYTDSA